MNLLNMFTLIYHGMVEPFASNHARRMDFFNEFGVIMITYFMFMYNDNLPDEDLKFMIGWAQVVVFALVILYNSFFVIAKMAKDSYLLCVKKYRIFRHKFCPRKVVVVEEAPVEEPVITQAEKRRRMRKLMTRTMPKSGLITMKKDGNLTIITE